MWASWQLPEDVLSRSRPGTAAKATAENGQLSQC
jgi:hypothetical protein